MAFMFRARLPSFLAGAATSAVLGFYLLYKDYMFAHEAVSRQVRGICETLDERYDALNGRITVLESLKEVETATTVEGSE